MFCFTCVDTDLRRQAFLLTLSTKVNLSWVFPKLQALGNEPPQTGQCRKGRLTVGLPCTASLGFKGNDREIGSESGEDGCHVLSLESMLLC